MEFNSVQSFLRYYEQVRDITLKVIAVVPAEHMDWTYRPGKFSIADLIRHIAAIERQLFAEIIAGRPMCYTGCGKELADGHDAVLAYFHEMHRQSMEIFASLHDEDLKKKIISASGKESSIAGFLRAMIIHETHHRAALCIYLNFLNIHTPPIFGLSAEDLVSKGRKNTGK